MRKVVLFIATSLDGYIADNNGGISWIDGQGTEETRDSYSEFIKDVDTVIMGWKTYEQITTELSPGQWVYNDQMSYVITHREKENTSNIKFTAENLESVVTKLKKEKGKDIWICGGAGIINQLMQKNLIDKFYISIIPTLLGQGIRLFDASYDELKLKLTDTKTSNGIVEVIYERR